MGPGRSVSSTKIFTSWALDGAFRQLKSSRLGALDVAFRQLIFFLVFGIISGIGVGCDFTNVDTSGILFSPIWFLYHFLTKMLLVSCCVSSTKIVGPLGPGRSVSSTIILAPWALDAAFRQL